MSLACCSIPKVLTISLFSDPVFLTFPTHCSAATHSRVSSAELSLLVASAGSLQRLLRS